MDLRIGGPLELSGRGHQRDLAFPKHRHPIGNPENLRNFMADHDGRKAEPPVHRHNQIVNRFRHQRIEPCRRLIEEDNLRLHDQCACQSSPLSHATAQLGGKLVPHPRQPHFFQLLLNPSLHLRALHPQFLPQRKRDVLKDRQRVEQRCPLKQHREPFPHIVKGCARKPGNLHVADPHLATIRLHEPDHVLEKHTLSLSAAADNGREFADRDREINALQYPLPTQCFFHSRPA